MSRSSKGASSGGPASPEPDAGRASAGGQLSFNDLARAPAAKEPAPFTVSQIVRLASQQLEGCFANVWIEGEVSNLRRPSSGHLYFTLKDAAAQLAVVMFRSAAARLRFAIEDGLRLRCRGRLCIYEAQGRFQLTAEAAEPDGEGALRLAFEQLKRKLEAEGLFDPARKRPLPLLPRRIAVVTSPTGAAIRDILRVLHDRCPVQVVICPTAVQGNEAPAEIVRAIARADALGCDLLIVGRGGGSLEDLWAFNDEGVARAIAAARTPLIAAVGHEIDVTIADLVADRRAPTPSAAAEMAVPVMEELQQMLQVCGGRLQRALQQQLQAQALTLERLRRRLGSPTDQVNRSHMRLDDAGSRLESALRRRLAAEREQLASWRTRLAAQEPRVRLARDRAALVQLSTRLTACWRAQLNLGRGQLGQLAGRLEAMSPLAVLSRGYSLALDQRGQAVREAAAVAVGDPLTLRLHRGALRCTIVERETAGPEKKPAAPGPSKPRA